MAVPTLQLGRLVLREDLVVAETADIQGNRTLTLTGQESVPRHLPAAVAQRRSDFLGMSRTFVPVIFSVKTALDGFYEIQDVSGEIEDWDDGLVVFRWSANLVRWGTTAEVDIESRLSGAQTRSNDFTATGERTHAPAFGHQAYWAGASVPTVVSRPSSEGAMTVYRGVGNTVNPRWASTPQNYGLGRCRFIDGSGRERAGTQFSVTPGEAWELTNAVTSVKPGSSGGTFDIGAWDSGVFAYTSWSAQIGNPYVPITSFDYLTVLRDDYEVVVLRFMKSFTPSGRLFVDMTLRRGSRVVELYLSNEYGTDLRVIHTSADAGTQTSGYVAGNANDAAGNRYMIGSARSYTADLVNGGVAKTATATLDVAVGVVLNGNTAVAGDTAADLYAQYLGMPAEQVQGVMR